MKLVVIALVGCLLANSQQLPKKESTPVLIEKVRRDPANLAGLAELAKRSDDPQVIPTLQDAFVQNKGSGATVQSGSLTIRLSQLTERGVRDDPYFNELAKYAREAIAADPPDSFIMNAEGAEEPDKGHSRAFDEWCARRSLNFNDCMGRPKSAHLDRQ